MERPAENLDDNGDDGENRFQKTIFITFSNRGGREVALCHDARHPCSSPHQAGHAVVKKVKGVGR